MTAKKNAKPATAVSFIPKQRIKKLKYNKKQAVKNFLKKFETHFDMEDDAIDLRVMAENYPNGIVPLQDIAEAISVLAGPTYDPSQYAEYDPQDPNSLSPRFAYVQWHELFLMPIFQRDVMWNHIKKIFQAFDPSCVSVPCAIKITINGRTIYAIWDGHHTLQTCRMKNYKSFPIWYIDIDTISQEEVEKAGYAYTPEGRMRYGIYKAGSNMRNINSKFKRQLSPYDDFMIGHETGDPDFVSMVNIYNKHGVKPKRHSTGMFALSQHKTAEECYRLEDTNGVKGRFLDRALAFHVKHWKSPLTMEIFRPMAYLYQRADLEGIKLDSKFDEELGKLLIKLYGDSESVQAKIKESYWNKLQDGRGEVLTHDKQRVLAGLINLYNQKIGRIVMPTSDWVWKV